MSSDKKGFWVNIGGTPVDLNSGMIEAVTNPPPGFVSKHRFVVTDVAARVNLIKWFTHCGARLALDLTMETEQAKGWAQAIESCKAPAWENAQLEAQNQLTLWLHLNERPSHGRWNEIVVAHKNAILNPLTEKILAPFQVKHDLDIALVHSVQWDILGALMENSYLQSGHSAFFFLELLTVYESGHFPCGWQGEWPQGKLLVY
jgi:hypothetical protein